ncbi:hypothetical protein GS489_01425 [Rhodococcus hoagii]|nr:hypothetical protein [Prescottella equi]
MAAPATKYTEESRRLFLRSVANKVDEVADAASAGPWLLSQTINDAIQVAPAPDNTERHLCGLIDPNDARAAVAADPANLRSLAYVMREAATNLETPLLIIDGLCDVAQRWDTAMLLRCSGVLHVAPPQAAAPAPSPAAPQVVAPTAVAADREPAPAAAVGAKSGPAPLEVIASTPAPAPAPGPAAPASPPVDPTPVPAEAAATRAPARKPAGTRKKPVPVADQVPSAAPEAGTGPAAAPVKPAGKEAKADASDPVQSAPATAPASVPPAGVSAVDDVWS